MPVCGSGGARLFIVAPDSQAKHACRQAEIPPSALFKNPGPALNSDFTRMFHAAANHRLFV